jgi:hypothetical protein
MRRNFLLCIVIIFAVVTNVILIGILVQSSDSMGANNLNNSSPEVTVSVISSKSDLLTTTPNDASNISTALSNEKLIIASVQENITSFTFKVSVTNNDSVQITINNVLVNNYPAILENKTTIISAHSSVELLFTFSEGLLFGQTYEIRILSLEGYSATYYKTIC